MIELEDGRSIGIAEYGDPAGAPVLWFHGAFSSRLEGGYLHAAAAELGLRLIALDRPGVGDSDPLPSRTVIGWAGDVEQVVDSLGIADFAVGGQSNGGMYAMAVGSALPDRVRRVVPYNASAPVADAAARTALSWKGRMSYTYLARKPEAVAQRLEDDVQPGRLAAALSRLTNPDARLLADPATAATWKQNTGEVLRQRGCGYLASEIRLTTQPWGFDHRAVPVPVTVVSGEKDAGLSHARVWAQELPKGRLVIVPGGHTGFLMPAVARTIAVQLSS